MADSYGPNVYFSTVVTALYNEMVALKAAIDGNGVSPTFAAVYNSHLGDGNWSFNAITVGLSTVDMKFPTLTATPVGRGIAYYFNVDIRVLIGYAEKTYPDEAKTRALAQSVVNWMEEHFTLDDGTYGDTFKIWDTGDVDVRAQFEDTGTIGALIHYTIRAHEGYEAK